MSGFDTSQPITDDAVLDEVGEKADAKKPESATPPALSEELGDATPGPR